jgi:putative Mg2+ transporter-C (MgtC) family protein
VPADVALQLDLSLRLLAAAVLGGIVGYEREVHQHPAGMRTHLLVSLGSALFTVLSVAGFTVAPSPNGSVPVDPSRVAAQIVTGIGFLGAGAILKYGTTIKGLTTAASLWATAAIGMAVGAGQWVIAVVGTTLAIVSLWPLHAIVQRFDRGGRVVRVRTRMADLQPFVEMASELGNRRIEITSLRTARSDGRYQLELDLVLPPGAIPAEVIHSLASIRGVELVDARRGGPEGEETTGTIEP